MLFRILTPFTFYNTPNPISFHPICSFFQIFSKKLPPRFGTGRDVGRDGEWGQSLRRGCAAPPPFTQGRHGMTAGSDKGGVGSSGGQSLRQLPFTREAWDDCWFRQGRRGEQQGTIPPPPPFTQGRHGMTAGSDKGGVGSSGGQSLRQLPFTREAWDDCWFRRGRLRGYGCARFGTAECYCMEIFSLGRRRRSTNRQTISSAGKR